MAVKIRKGTVMYQLPVTPMVDLVFNLLLFFIVATRFAEEDREVALTLPEASEAEPVIAKPREMLLSVDQEGHFFLAGKPLVQHDLEQALKTAWVNNPTRVSVVIRADERCPWKFVVAAMNACSNAKIRDYRVVTRGGSG